MVERNNGLLKLIHLVNKAQKANPMLDLARQLYSDSYDEKSFNASIAEGRNIGGIVDDVAVLTVRNYLRDLEKGIVK